VLRHDSSEFEELRQGLVAPNAFLELYRIRDGQGRREGKTMDKVRLNFQSQEWPVVPTDDFLQGSSQGLGHDSLENRPAVLGYNVVSFLVVDQMSSES
jgi:hypothetical protein